MEPTQPNVIRSAPRKVLAVRMSETGIAMLDKHAARLKVSRSEVLRRMLADAGKLPSWRS